MLSVSWEHLSSLKRTDGESRRQLPIGRLDDATDGRRSRSRGGRRRRRTPRRQAVSGKKNDRESAEENRRRPPPPPAAAAGVAPRFFGGVKITSNQTFGVITSVVRGRRVSCSVAHPGHHRRTRRWSGWRRREIPDAKAPPATTRNSTAPRSVRRAAAWRGTATVEIRESKGAAPRKSRHPRGGPIQ